jgi:hypothetical protein
MPDRNVTPEGWGKAVLEEVLFRGASQVSADTPAPGAVVEVTLTTRITADPVTGALELRVDSLTDDALVTQLHRPF